MEYWVTVYVYYLHWGSSCGYNNTVSLTINWLEPTAQFLSSLEEHKLFWPLFFHWIFFTSAPSSKTTCMDKSQECGYLSYLSQNPKFICDAYLVYFSQYIQDSLSPSPPQVCHFGHVTRLKFSTWSFCYQVPSKLWVMLNGGIGQQETNEDRLGQTSYLYRPKFCSCNTPSSSQLQI